MKKIYLAGTIAALTVAAGAARAQVLYSQPWLSPRASFESVVKHCDSPTPTRMAAADDWIARVDSPITRIEWWGTFANPATPCKRYYVAIYRHNPATNKPDLAGLLFKQCVYAQWTAAGVDCKQQRVFKLNARFAGPYFAQKVGQHYWIQISEADADSAKPGAPEFRWSGTRPIRFAPAVQWNAAKVFTQPIKDVCDGQPDDLAFILYRS